MKTPPKHLIFPVAALALLSGGLLAGCGQEQAKTIVAKPARNPAFTGDQPDRRGQRQRRPDQIRRG